MGTLPISAKTGEGLDALKAALVSFARENFGATEAPLITRARHRQEIERARAALASFLASAGASDHPELAAEHLREAADALGRLTGRLDVEDVLGQIFSEFCIGKEAHPSRGRPLSPSSFLANADTLSGKPARRACARDGVSRMLLALVYDFDV